MRWHKRKGKDNKPKIEDMAIKLRDPLNLNLRIVSRYKPDVFLAEQKSGFIDGAVLMLLKSMGLQ